MFNTPVLSYRGTTPSFLPTVVEPHPSGAWLLSSPIHAPWSVRGDAPAVPLPVPPVLCTRFCFPSALSRGQQPGWPRGAWILGNEAMRNGVGWSHYTTPQAGHDQVSCSSISCLHLWFLPSPLFPNPDPVGFPGSWSQLVCPCQGHTQQGLCVL